jgi:antitoxin (DNA-binding transcriptional repressor) of toxin-antitoxin stability system
VLVAQAALVIARVASGEPVVRVASGEPVVRAGLVEPVVRAGLVELAALAELVVQVAQEALAELVVRVAPAGPEPGPVQVLAVLAPGHPRAQRAVVLGTKSVTVAHRRGLQLLAPVEDLAAAVAETMRAPAATEAVVAWGVVVTAVAAAGIVVAVGAVAAAVE